MTYLDDHYVMWILKI